VTHTTSKIRSRRIQNPSPADQHAAIHESAKPESYDACSHNECRCVVKLLPLIATRDAGDERAEPDRRIEVPYAVPLYRSSTSRERCERCTPSVNAEKMPTSKNPTANTAGDEEVARADKVIE
jgi:hypothetical protein